MRDEQHWPQFELVSCEEPTDIPHGWDHDLVALGVPKRILGNYYTASCPLGLIEYPTLGPVVRFASMGRKGAMCLHPATQSIRWMTNLPSGPEWFVNASLAQFNDSVRAMISRFPFERGASSSTSLDGTSTSDASSQASQGYVSATYQDDVEWVPIGEELRAILRRIDPAAVAHPNAYWNTFVDDVQMGNYSLEDVLMYPTGRPVIRHRRGGDGSSSP